MKMVKQVVDLAKNFGVTGPTVNSVIKVSKWLCW